MQMQKFKCNEKYIAPCYNFRKEIEMQLIQSFPTEIACKFPLKKLIRLSCNLIRMNLLESALLSWLLKRSRYDLERLSQSSTKINVVEQSEYKSMLLLVLLNSYYVKIFLNESVCPKINYDIAYHIPAFSEIYRAWRPDDSLINATFQQVNHCFEQWTYQPFPKQKMDYNQLVNKILDLSKTYNVNGPAELKDQVKEEEPRKKRKVNEKIEIDKYSDDLEEVEERLDFLKSSQSNRKAWQFDEIKEDQLIHELNPLRRSTRNMNMNISYYNFNNSIDMTDSRNRLFQSKSIVNNNFRQDSLISNCFIGESSVKKGVKLKPTTSFDQIT